MTLYRLSKAATLAWSVECEAVLASASDRDAIIAAAGSLALARYGLRVGPGAPPRQRGGARVVSRLARGRPAGPDIRWQTTGVKLDP